MELHEGRQETSLCFMGESRRHLSRSFISIFSELCWEKAIVAYTKSQQRKKAKRASYKIQEG